MKSLSQHLNESIEHVQEAYKSEFKVKIGEIFKSSKDIIKKYGGEEINTGSSFRTTIEIADDEFLSFVPVDAAGDDVNNFEPNKSKSDYGMKLDSHYYINSKKRNAKPVILTK